MNAQPIGPGDLVALQDNGKTLRGIVAGSPISGMLKIDVPTKAKPYYLSTDQVELLVRANYDIHADDPHRGPDLAVVLQGGLVQYIRSSAPVNARVVDLDVFDTCYGDEESLCHIDEAEADRREHDEVRISFEATQQLAVEAYP